MKRITKTITFFLTLLLLTQSVFAVQAKGENKKPDPHFKNKATYVERSRVPYYGNNAVVDTYIADGMFYSVDIVTQDVVDIHPEEMSYQVDATYNEDQLRGMAETMVTDFLGDKVKLDKLSFLVVTKLEKTYFFKWEDVSKKIDTGIYPFVQVGFSRNGDFLNFTNTLPFGKELVFSSSSVRRARTIPHTHNFIGPFTQIYANGGAYWAPAWAWSYATGGYFGTPPIPAGCSGTFCSKYYYTTASVNPSVYGKWTPNSNTKTRASAYIPAQNATATVQYEIGIPGSNPIYTLVDQLSWTGWKLITPSTITNGISYVKLWNIGFNGTGSSGAKVGWDELWVYNP